MDESRPGPAFASTGQFEAAYSYVSDPVCLFSPDSGVLIAGNPVFWQQWEMDEAPDADNRLFVSALTEDGISEVTIVAKDKKRRFFFKHISHAMLVNNPVKLGIVERQIPEVDKEDNLLAAEAEKKALLTEVYHRVKNNLNIIISLLSLQVNRVSTPEMRLLLLESKSRIFTLSLLQQNLYSSPRISEIKAANYLQALANSVLSTFKPKEKHIQLVTKLEESWLDIDTLTPLGLMVHELLSNAVLHAFAKRESGKISLIFKQPQPACFLLQIHDNGGGLPHGKAAGEYTTLGFQLISSLSKQLDARLDFNSDPLKGTSVTVEFKITGK